MDTIVIQWYVNKWPGILKFISQTRGLNILSQCIDNIQYRLSYMQQTGVWARLQNTRPVNLHTIE